MPTQAQIDAARRNGAKSNGPKTPEGKAISSKNALRHGLTAKSILLTNENPEAYQELAAAYYEKFQPADDVERDLVDEMVIAKWRQRRDWSNEAALFDLEMDRQTKKIDSEYKKIDHPYRFALAFRALADVSKALLLASRYETTHRCAYYKALSPLLQVRSHQQPSPAPATPPVSADEPAQTDRSDTSQPACPDQLASSESLPAAADQPASSESNPPAPTSPVTPPASKSPQCPPDTNPAKRTQAPPPTEPRG